MYQEIMVSVCNWCIQLLRDLSAMTGLSYEEINVWLFIIIQPGLILFFYFRSRNWKKQYQQSSNDIRQLIQATLERGRK
tara:strand:+ start:11550 stop:11786 length:237 start_codon:yes stop_codon:yes gene_type:complete